MKKQDTSPFAMHEGERFNSISHLIGAIFALTGLVYLLIAGTYTPLTLITLRGGWGWSLFGVIWGLALLGLILEFLLTTHKKPITLGIYATMGWLVVFAIQPLWKSLPGPGLVTLVIGGVF